MRLYMYLKVLTNDSFLDWLYMYFYMNEMSS